LTYAADSLLRDAGLQDSQEDDLQDEFLGPLPHLAVPLATFGCAMVSSGMSPPTMPSKPSCSAVG
jgi:hypothetical protein